MLAVNPGQWFGDSLPVGDMEVPTVQELDNFDLDALGLELDYSVLNNGNFVLQTNQMHQMNM